MAVPKAYWRWEESPYPTPARRLVIPAAVRLKMNRFLNYTLCPVDEGSERAHRRKHLMHVILSTTGECLCLAEEAVLEMERGNPALFIRTYDEIPNGNWEPLPLGRIVGWGG